MSFKRTPAALLAHFVLGCNLCLAAGPNERHEYETPRKVTFVVTADGLSSIVYCDQEIAQGGWYAWNAGPKWFGTGSEGVLAYAGYSRSVYEKAAADLREKSLEILSPSQVRVRHVQPDIVTTYEYTFAGEDVTIHARLDNNHSTDALTVPAFGGLRFTFAEPPQGIMKVWHTSYLAHQPKAVFHPSALNKIGGSYATDNAIGVGVTPRRTGIGRSLIFWDYDDWRADTREKVPERWLSYLRPESVAAGGALTFELRIRVSPTTDWQHLLGPYKEHFLETYGPRQYRADDHRVMAVAHVNRDRKSITPENPYGFHGGFRRLDLKEGVAAFCDLLIPALKEANGQGVILWGQGGEHPRGAMYRADFDILPPEVEANWSTLVGRFSKAGFKVGVCTRPRHLPVPLSWDHDGTLDINPEDKQHLDILWGRFQKMIDRGCTLFYLDSFGHSLEDVKTMQHLRGRMGPNVQTYAEHACDAILPYSGLYTETDFWAEGTNASLDNDAYVPRTGLRFQQIGRWLVGDLPCITRLYNKHGELPKNFEPHDVFFLRNHMTPMVPDYVLPRVAKGMRELQKDYLDDHGGWRDQTTAPRDP